MGHSLGGMVATLYAMRLHSEGHSIAKLVTFGQPKVVKSEEITKCAELARVVSFVFEKC